ncbi:MAG: hypothetical protein KDJ86_08340 [Bauldia sp.]|uniref:hypothetical protein n=1 Tax=Bauldia sp. TaxID=2575872 RepID=UPI001DC8AC8D|nr:hypothetical protein [Bauldia sp.]MCB1495779.1 hypothetical protein [Bauldia sp.]MCB2131606.1 hypothetical protein [Paracoccaceae bacterium]
MRKPTVIVTLTGLTALGQFAGSAFADEIIPQGSLAGTIWASTDSHDRTTIGVDGKISLKEGKDIYIRFGDLVDEVYTIETHWWNIDAGLSVVEYAVAVPEEDNVYAYVEPHHPSDSGFPGIEGHGTIHIIDANTIDFSQVGRLTDGSASAFATQLTRVDKAPEVPIPQTYPKP